MENQESKIDNSKRKKEITFYCMFNDEEPSFQEKLNEALKKHLEKNIFTKSN